MATKVILTEQYLKDIANAIREKSGSQSPLKPSEMASAIKHIHQGIDPEGTLEITESGTYDITNYATAEVDIPISPLETQVNGVYQKEDGGYNPVTVSVPPYSDPNRTKTITENGSYSFKSSPSGTGEQPPAVIQVAVPNPAAGTKSITENGTHNVKDYEFAQVNIPPYSDPNRTKSITENGTYNFKSSPSASGEEPPATLQVEVPPYGEGTVDLVISDVHGSYDVDGYKRANISVSTDELVVTENGVYQPRYDQMILGYTKVTVNCPVPKIISFNNNWFHTTPEYGEDYNFEADNISMVDGRPSSMNPLSVGDKIVTTLDVENTFWMVRGTVKTITATTVTVTLDHAEIIV